MRIFTPQNEYVMRKLLYLVIGLLFVFAIPSGAQPECVFTHYSSEEGLSQNTVMSILQDRKGNMWFATWDGINKFDGYDFRTYKAKFDNRINLTNNRVDYMYEDRYGFLWLLTYDNQAWRFNPRTEVFERVPAMKEEGSRFVVTSIKVLPCGSVWLLSEGEGAIRIKTDPESFRLSSEMYSADNGLFPAARVYDVYEDASGNKITAMDGENISFRYRDYRNSPDRRNPIEKELTLHYREFFPRLLQHGPLRYFRIVRYYGFYSNKGNLPEEYFGRDESEIEEDELQPAESGYEKHYFSERCGRTRV